MTKKFKSDAFELIRSSVAALLEIGAIDKTVMFEFDVSFITQVPAQLKPAQIKRAREKTCFSKSSPGT